MVFTADYNCYVSFNDTNWRKELFFNFIETIGLWNIILIPFEMEIRKNARSKGYYSISFNVRNVKWTQKWIYIHVIILIIQIFYSVITFTSKNRPNYVNIMI